MGRIRSTLSSAKYKIGVGNPKYGKTTDSFFTADLNYWGNKSDGILDVTSNISLSNSVDDYVKVLQLSYLRIRSGYTLTTANRCRGLAIYVDGDALIEGTLTMTARGAYTPNLLSEVNSNGLQFARRKIGSTQTLANSIVSGCGTNLINVESAQNGILSNGKIYQMPRLGGAGGASVSNGSGGGLANVGSSCSLSCGGGGSGSAWYGTGGAGAQGTCFSGGGGGGGGDGCSGTSAVAYGGMGGKAGSDYRTWAPGGGAGNPGGNGAFGSGPVIGNNTATKGQDGTGGLLLLFIRGTLTITSTAVISSNGKNGGSVNNDPTGGGSGGGNILILYGTGYSNSGTVQANGGAGGVSTLYPQQNNGGAGGAGSIVVEQIQI